MVHVPPPPTRYGPPVVQAKPAPARSTAPAHTPPPLPPRPVFLPPTKVALAVRTRLRGPTMPWMPRFPAPTVQAKFARVIQRSSEAVESDSDDEDGTKGLGEGKCSATLTYDDNKGTSGSFDGAYSGKTYEHAEIAALSAYCESGDYATAKLKGITEIVVTSPCCKVCRYVMSKIGLLGKITARGGTGSCKGAYGAPSSPVLRKLIFDTIGSMDDPYASVAKRKVSDYDTTQYWQLLKDMCQR